MERLGYSVISASAEENNGFRDCLFERLPACFLRQPFHESIDAGGAGQVVNVI